MSGIVTANVTAQLRDLGSFPDKALTGSFSMGTIDEYVLETFELAFSVDQALSVGQIGTVVGVWVHCVQLTGASAGLALNIHKASTTWADQAYNDELLDGEATYFRPTTAATPTLSVKNEHGSAAATVTYFMFGT